MNLTPRWSDFLQLRGYQAVHWSLVGPETAPDSELLAWAKDNSHVILTNDLDFGGMLAVSGDREPSIVQIRSDVLSPERIGDAVHSAIRQTEAELREGALLTVETGRSRLRLLPFSHFQRDE
ncbi:MAG: DUF5615 family PIN-like protein [Hyphomicrobiales bacterium]